MNKIEYCMPCVKITREEAEELWPPKDKGQLVCVDEPQIGKCWENLRETMIDMRENWQSIEEQVIAMRDKQRAKERDAGEEFLGIANCIYCGGIKRP